MFPPAIEANIRTPSRGGAAQPTGVSLKATYKPGSRHANGSVLLKTDPNTVLSRGGAAR